MSNQLLAFEEPQRAAFLSVMSTLAMADGEVDEEEGQFIEAMCKSAEVTHKSKIDILHAAYHPEDVDLGAQLKLIDNNNLRFYLVTDILMLATADGEFSKEELKELAMLQAQLNLKEEQFEALQKYVESYITFKEEGVTENFLEKAGLKEKFEELGIPMEAFAEGTTVGEMLSKSALGIAEKELEGTKAGAVLEVGKAVGGIFIGLAKAKKNPNKKKKRKGLFKKIFSKKINKG